MQRPAPTGTVGKNTVWCARAMCSLLFVVALAYLTANVAGLIHAQRSPALRLDSTRGVRLYASRSTGHANPDGVRLNKCLDNMSRRAADEAILAKLVTINGAVATCGSKVRRGDIVRYKGVVQNWQLLANAKTKLPSSRLEDQQFVYVKYWKPVGVTCTSDPSDPSNIITAGQFSLLPQRVFTVGRLDKDSSGLILLTSDGRVNNAMLNAKSKKEKTYIVETDRPATDAQIEQLSTGVVITTPIQRDTPGLKVASKVATVTARTRPCYVKRVQPRSGSPTQRNLLQFTLVEGRNRQIRRMLEVVGLQVVSLHRTRFAGIGLKGLSEGNWAELNAAEMEVIQKAIQVHTHAQHN